MIINEVLEINMARCIAQGLCSPRVQIRSRYLIFIISSKNDYAQWHMRKSSCNLQTAPTEYSDTSVHSGMQGWDVNKRFPLSSRFQKKADIRKIPKKIPKKKKNVAKLAAILCEFIVCEGVHSFAS
jgi:hypothetical protein